METTPKVSVGVPVRNGQAILEVTLRSLASQDYPNLDVVISDNASTDATCDIARGFLSDRRFRIHHERVDIGASDNFLNLFERSQDPLFMWASCGEEWRSDHISKLVDLLVRFPRADLAVSHMGLIDGDTGTKADTFWHRNPVPTTSLSKFDRLKFLLSTEGGTTNIYGHMFYGLFRREALGRVVPMVRNAEFGFGVDVLAILALLSRGDLVVNPERTFWYRTGGASVDFRFKDIANYQAYCAFCAERVYRNVDLSGLGFEETREIHAKQGAFVQYFTGFDSSYQAGLIRQAWETSRRASTFG